MEGYYMLFVLAGPSYVGKKTAMHHFIKLYSFSSIIPYTTKPLGQRTGEVEGIKYHYVDPENKGIIENREFIHDCPFNYLDHPDSVIYAYKKTDIERAINSYSNFIIHASVNNAINIYEQYHEDNIGHLYIIFLNYSATLTKTFFEDKFKKMDQHSGGGPLDQSEFLRRFYHAQKEQEVYHQNIEKFDKEIKGDQPYDICSSLESYILPKLVVMPTAPDRIPGALSDSDIIYMIEKRQKDKLCIKLEDHILSGEDITRRLSGCSLQLSLSPTIRTIKKYPGNSFIDMAQEEHALNVKLQKIYMEYNIGLGYILKPNETILCSSAESITVPQDIYAIVSARFSYTQLGLSIELGTSVIQSGHEGKIHFQIKNNTSNSICIYPGIQVLQLLLFRTIQPCSARYHDKAGVHGYDTEGKPPISKFNLNNRELSNVQKPGSNFFKRFLESLQAGIIERIIGLIVCVSAFTAALSYIQTFWNNNIMPIWSASSSAVQFIQIVIAVNIVNGLFYIIGKALICFKDFVIHIIREKAR